MDDLGVNKIAAAILATALGFMGLKEISHSALHAKAPKTPVYMVGEISSGETAVVEEEMPFPQEDWVMAMDTERGKTVFKKCASCHNADNGGPNGLGPNLWDTVGKPAGGKSGFNYSSAMTSSGLIWDFETLDGFLTRPSQYLNGTSMSFVGLKKPEDRAAVIEYLRTASSSSMDKPKAVSMEAAGLDEALPPIEDLIPDENRDVVDAITQAEDNAAQIITDNEKSLQELSDDVQNSNNDGE